MVKGFGEGCRWEPDPGAPVSQHTRCSEGRSVHDLVAWLVTAQAALDELGLGYDKNFEVHIHQIASLGFVNPREGRRILHISDDNTRSPSWVKFIALHEYFHNAQGHDSTEIGDPGNGLLIDVYKSTDWLTEGTASWFPAELGDDMEAVFVDRIGGERVMEVGLDSSTTLWFAG